VEAADINLRAKCKAIVDRLKRGDANIRVEKCRGAIRELKVSWKRQEFRFLFFQGGTGAIYLLVFFQKKTQKIPPAMIDLAERRMREIQLEQSDSRTVH
jgi:phage-related protein